MLQLLTNAEVFAPHPLGRQHILVAGERIAWIGPQLPALPASLGASERDLGGRRVIPGLIDAHAHLTGGGGECGYASRVPRLHLTQLTTAGITTAVGLLGTDDLVHTTGELVAAARGLRTEGLTTFCYTGGYHVPPTTLTGSVRGDLVHIDLILGVGEVALSDHRSSQPSLDELLRLAAEAHVGGIMTGKAGIAHLHLGDGDRGLEMVRAALDRAELPARVFHPTHVNRRRALLDEAFTLVERGCTIDVTAFPPDDDRELTSAADSLQRYIEASLPPERITASSDGGGCMPVFDADGQPVGFDVGRPSLLSDTLAELLSRGVAVEVALPPFTSNVADLLRLPTKGRLAKGADADLVVLDDAHHPTDVMARGRWHVLDGEPKICGSFEAQDAE